MPVANPIHEPHKTKTVRLVSFPTPEERKRNLARAHFNVFNMTPSEIAFDMVSNAGRASTPSESGDSSMSNRKMFFASALVAASCASAMMSPTVLCWLFAGTATKKWVRMRNLVMRCLRG